MQTIIQFHFKNRKYQLEAKKCYRKFNCCDVTIFWKMTLKPNSNNYYYCCTLQLQKNIKLFETLGPQQNFNLLRVKFLIWECLTPWTWLRHAPSPPLRPHVERVPVLRPCTHAIWVHALGKCIHTCTECFFSAARSLLCGRLRNYINADWSCSGRTPQPPPHRRAEPANERATVGDAIMQIDARERTQKERAGERSTRSKN